MIQRLDKYKKNLCIINDTMVYSYDTHVATIAGATLYQHEWDYRLGVRTTQKHINYVADQLDLDIVHQISGCDV